MEKGGRREWGKGNDWRESNEINRPLSLDERHNIEVFISGAVGPPSPCSLGCPQEGRAKDKAARCACFNEGVLGWLFEKRFLETRKKIIMAS